MKKLKIAALALFIGCAFGFLMPVQVWAVDYPGGPIGTYDLITLYHAGEEEFLCITGDTSLNIDFDLTVDYIVVKNGCNLTITGESGKTLTCICGMISE